MRPYSILLSILFLASCNSNLKHFTQRMYDEFNWTEDDIRHIQFYVSEDIRLWRDAGADETVIRNGKVRIVDGREIEEIMIKKGTPGVVLFSPKENRFAVSFDETDDSFLMFGPNEKVRGRYVLLAKEWNRNQGKITYKGAIYNTDSQSAYASLLLDIKAARKLKYNSSVAGGRRID